MIPNQRHRHSIISTCIEQISLIHRLIDFLTYCVSKQGLIQIHALSLIHYPIGLVVFLLFQQQFSIIHWVMKTALEFNPQLLSALRGALCVRPRFNGFQRWMPSFNRLLKIIMGDAGLRIGQSTVIQSGLTHAYHLFTLLLVRKGDTTQDLRVS